jgi:hypothetical protein
MESYHIFGLPFGSLDIVLTHYRLDTDYAPFIPLMNQLFASFNSKLVYDIYFICLVLSSCFVIPFCALHAITQGLEYPIFFLYGTAFGMNHFLVGLIPQAILIDLVLLGLWKRELFPFFFVLSMFIHTFGPAIVGIGWLWSIFRGFKHG